MKEALQPYTKWHHIERDPAVFSVKIDEDYVHCLQGVTRASYCNVYLEWIQYCANKLDEVGCNNGNAMRVLCTLPRGGRYRSPAEMDTLYVMLRSRDRLGMLGKAQFEDVINIFVQRGVGRSNNQ